LTLTAPPKNWIISETAPSVALLWICATSDSSWEHVHGQSIDIVIGDEPSEIPTAIVASVRKISRPWTEYDDKRLLTMSAQKRSPLSMALSMKRTKAAITSRLSILRVAEAARDHKDIA
jgi:hypothetical protein